MSRWGVNAESNGKWIRVFYGEVARGAPAPLAAVAATREIRKSALHILTNGRECRLADGDIHLIGSTGGRAAQPSGSRGLGSRLSR